MSLYPGRGCIVGHFSSSFVFVTYISYVALTNFLRPSVDIDFGLSKGSPKALSQIKEAVTPIKRII